MILEQIQIGPMQNFGYVIGCEQTKEGAIVDPGFQHQKLLEKAQELGLNVTKIIVTHSHYDHVTELPFVYKATGATIVIGETDPYPTEEYAHVERVGDGDQFMVGNLAFTSIFTPGHHMGETCYLHEDKMLTGDMLFVGGCGRVDLPESNPDDMWESIQKLQQMHKDIQIFPGHDYGETSVSTLGHERVHNPFFRCKTKEEFFAERGVR